MAINDIIIPIVWGAVIMGIIAWFLFMFYWILKVTGLLKLIGKLYHKKPSEEIYVEVAKQLKENKSFEDFAVYISKFPKKIQNKYIEAYLEIRELKGG